MECKKADHGLSPKFTKSQAIQKWVDSFILHISQKVGVCNAPLDYVVRAVASVDLSQLISNLGRSGSR